MKAVIFHICMIVLVAADECALHNLDFADGFGMLPEFRSVYELCCTLPADADGDGALSREELRSSYGDDAAKLMRLDRNEDGKIDESELRWDLSVAREIEALFLLGADTDRDGSLSEAELHAAYSESEAKGMMLLDSDRNGVVTVAELFGARRDHELPSDADEDGVLSRGEIDDEVIDVLDLDEDGGVEAHEVVASMREADIDASGLLSKDEVLRAYGRGPAASLVSRVGPNLTPRASTRRMWSVLKGCGTAPCGLDEVLTAAELEDAARAVLVPVYNVTGDITFDDFAAWVQRALSSYVTAAIDHLVDAGALNMARSLVVQQLVVVGLGVQLPRLLETAARERIPQPEPKEMPIVSPFTFRAQVAAYITTLLLIALYIYVEVHRNPPNQKRRLPNPPALDLDRDQGDRLAEHQLLQAYFAGAIGDALKAKLPILKTSHPPLASDIWQQAHDAGYRDARIYALNSTGFADSALVSIAELEAHRRRLAQQPPPRKSQPDDDAAALSS